ncbi:MAG: hypothetical protein Q8O56_05995 [Solirubrobacteraceae bacterium]|nr:hypothetical protein [Solirubrobacteraceae bacterium]
MQLSERPSYVEGPTIDPTVDPDGLFRTARLRLAGPHGTPPRVRVRT